MADFSNLHDPSNLITSTLLAPLIDLFKTGAKPTQNDWLELLKLAYHYTTYTDNAKGALYKQCLQDFKTSNVVTQTMMQNVVTLFKDSISPYFDFNSYSNFKTGKVPTASDFNNLLSKLVCNSTNYYSVPVYVGHADYVNIRSIETVTKSDIRTFMGGAQFSHAGWSPYDSANHFCRSSFYLPAIFDGEFEFALSLKTDRTFTRYNYIYHAYYMILESDGSWYTDWANPLPGFKTCSNVTSTTITLDTMAQIYEGYPTANSNDLRGLFFQIERE